MSSFHFPFLSESCFYTELFSLNIFFPAICVGRIQELHPLTLICIEALQNQWCFRGFFLFCNHLHLEPRVMHCQLPATLDFSLWPLLVSIINRGYLFGLSTSPVILFCLVPSHEIFGKYTKKGHFAESAQVFLGCLTF